MCLAVPARIISINKIHALVETMGVRQRVNILLIDSPVPGDYILIHAGFAIERIEPEYFRFLNDTLFEIPEDSENE